MAKSRSIRLSFYLATQARGDRPPEPGDPIDRQRLGRPDIPRPPGPLVWFHTGHQGPSASIRELARRINLERDDIGLLFTHCRNRSLQSDPEFIDQVCPDDTLAATRRFFAHWRPTLGVWTEPDLRPALMTEADNLDIPLMLVDTHDVPGQIATGVNKRIATDLIRIFQAVFAGDTALATAYQQLGASPDKVEAIGFLREGTPAPSCSETERQEMAHLIAGRPTWLAACVTEAELSSVEAAHRQAQRRSHRLLLILVPDDRANAVAWCDALKAKGYNVALRSNEEDPEPDTQIYIADTPGEMGLWYRIAPISFLGRSLSEDGGINPFEAATLGSAVVHGPNIAAYQNAYDRLKSSQAARSVETADALGDTIEALLSPARAAELARQAWEVTSAGADVTDRLLDLILAEIETV